MFKASIIIVVGLFVIIGCNMQRACGVSHNWDIGLTVLTYITSICMIIGIAISLLPKEKPKKKKVNYISKITW